MNASTALPGNETVTEYRSVGGWLALFCVGLFVYPLLAIGQWYFAVTTASTALDHVEGVRAFLTLAAVVDVANAIWAVVTGIRLVRRDDGAVAGARALLITQFILIWLVLPMLWVLCVPAIPVSAWFGHAIVEVLRGTLAAAVWLAYFAKSRRVRLTYGPPPVAVEAQG